MMGYLYNGYGGGMIGYRPGILSFIFCLVLFIDAVLLGIWLWQQISKK